MFLQRGARNSDAWIKNEPKQLNDGEIVSLFISGCGKHCDGRPVRTEVNGCTGSKGHFSLPDSRLAGSSWKTPSWKTKRRIVLPLEKIPIRKPYKSDFSCELLPPGGR